MPPVAVSVQCMKLQLPDPRLWCGQKSFLVEILDEILVLFEMEILE